MPNIERKEELDIKSQNQQNWKKYINDLALNNYNYFVYNLKLKTNEREKNFKIIHREIENFLKLVLWNYWNLNWEYMRLSKDQIKDFSYVRLSWAEYISQSDNPKIFDFKLLPFWRRIVKEFLVQIWYENKNIKLIIEKNRENILRLLEK
ncbi:MAG: hypothetical protein ACD_4C00115G0005 [uncultured bacterium (gcode 4)]|uniref:Uncharacterized protein n=1 Tax=uncultured bacterium (gcode 4) TaxID=1234023 RepID=K2G9T0_9BACT|nr:MAG: hypothetical protein ACD_4C00115G0005 [uncultured bacterium (gcode 4)]